MRFVSLQKKKQYLVPVVLISYSSYMVWALSTEETWISNPISWLRFQPIGEKKALADFIIHTVSYIITILR